MSIRLARRGASAVRRSQSGGAFYANAIYNPSAAGYPDETNTGVPPGTVLTTIDRLTVTTNGAIIENYHVTQVILVRADNVTIRNCRIETDAYYPIDYDGVGMLVEDCEIIGTHSQVTSGISFGYYTARRVHIRNTGDGFKANANVLIEDCYVSGLFVTPEGHNDGVQCTGGSGVILRHNTFKLGDSAGANAVIQFGTEDGMNTDWLVEDNLMDGGGWIINSGFPGDSSMRFLNNRFTRRYAYGVIGAMPNSIWTGNYYDDDGSVAP